MKMLLAYKNKTKEAFIPREVLFPEKTVKRLQSLGELVEFPHGRNMTKAELIEYIQDVDVCITCWGCPQFDKDVLNNANKLKFIAHAAGSIARIASEESFQKGIKISSANNIMSKIVAESILGFILSSCRNIMNHDRSMKEKKIWEAYPVISLVGKTVGFVGLGSVGRHLYNFLKPFDVNILLFDPYILEKDLSGYDQIKIASLDDVLSKSDIISIHASKTPETFHMIDAKKLKLIKDNAVFVNAARGAIIDEAALCEELKTKRFSAILDVFEEEPLSLESPLREMQNVILQPHQAGKVSDSRMADAMADEIERLVQGKPLKYQISYEQFKLMTLE